MDAKQQNKIFQRLKERSIKITCSTDEHHQRNVFSSSSVGETFDDLNWKDSWEVYE
jgi:hypothetical protein